MDDKHFKKVFELDDNIMVSQSVIDTYEKYLEGSILLFKHLFDNINSYEFSIEANGFDFKFIPVKQGWYCGQMSFKDFVKGYTSKFNIELNVENSSYFTRTYSKETFKWLSARDISQNNFNRKTFDSTPFDKESEDLFILNLFKDAYHNYKIKLNEEVKKYRNEYGVTAKYNYYGPSYLYGCGASTPLRFGGIAFIDELIVYDGSKPIELNDYNIECAIENEIIILK